ncbi:MAG: divalent metal cation transporter FieF [Alphaproteobacteria bacterium]|nr:divalent metal cation transporter FieF [Alphaproteobacteria bacterium]|tara:strand:+ start:3196 stop:4158 length:963 start_codon:yes stop_codon:yes gene_type:complete
MKPKNESQSLKIKNTHTPSSLEKNQRLIRVATRAAVIVACVLIVVKLGAWLIVDSVVLLSSFVDSVMDTFASLINLLAVRHAMQPADSEHRFGHGKMESIAGLGQAAFIIGSGIFLFVEAIGRILNPVDIKMGSLGIGVMVFSMILTAGLVIFQRNVSQKTGSLAIKADSLHYTSDFLVNVGIILALVLAVTLGWQLADPIAGILVALVIIFSAIQIVRQSIDRLMDRELSDIDRENIINIALSHPTVSKCHDLRTRSAGLDIFIQLHIEMDGYLTLNQAHEVCDDVELKILKAYPNAEIIIHADPEGITEEHPDFEHEV